MPATFRRPLTAAIATMMCLSPATTASAASVDRQKVLLIVEENRSYPDIIGNADAPYLNTVARTYGTATAMTANYPVGCPSLAAYILITSGSTAGICDDAGPDHHRISGPNIFSQLDAAHRRWRNYAEDLPGPCARKNDRKGIFLVRHTAVPYYVSESRACAIGQVDLHRLSRDLTSGTLPDYSLVIPNSCHDMHGAAACTSGGVTAGDTWLRHWLPRILNGADYRAGRLVIIVTWDEGSATDNHIPTLVISPHTHQVTSNHPHDHCSTLLTIEELLRLAPLGCARTTASMVSDFHL
ncbi:alkaline phosphatase family protein [Actinoplanes sp. NPDC020271]|uniref:alkaline phosphatase family protein n=1 Tax=Actinoplanes sp. NPDC020271 TaxID=3363896 RepID=UPI0037A6C315